MTKSKSRTSLPQESAAVRIPVIDLFAGPGGLGEGFAACSETECGSSFRLALSVEKDPIAHQTLELRSFIRQFDPVDLPTEYLEFAKGSISREQLFSTYPHEAEQARSEAWCAELGPKNRGALTRRIRKAIDGALATVLIGGPPCQAYSLVGRSRNGGNPDYDPNADARHTLYREYLHVLATQWPAVFVMENVKGILSARFENERMFERIVNDLQDPAGSQGSYDNSRTATRVVNRRESGRTHTYRLYPLARYGTRPLDMFEESDSSSPSADPHDYIVRAEQHGVPQARHRVILLGVRDDVEVPDTIRLPTSRHRVNIESVIGSLPRLRSGISREEDSSARWRESLRAILSTRWQRKLQKTAPKIAREIEIAIGRASLESLARGQEVLVADPAMAEELAGDPEMPEVLAVWYATERTPATFNHTTRAHIRSDLHRYVFAAAYAKVVGKSPTLSDFPGELLPDHRNAEEALGGGLFSDRFRVQVAGSPSSTITSHISKDGHYYIHYDPSQGRSLTVREAARLQTFPDNYFFCGPRTAQYHQVGNAVPPLLAKQIAEVVAEILAHDRARAIPRPSAKDSVSSTGRRKAR